MQYSFFQIKLSKNYKPKDFREDLKEAMLVASCQGLHKLFLLNDTQIVYESFLEDINNVLNTGEITNLYKKAEDTERIKEAIVPVLKQLKRIETWDMIY